MGRSHLHKDTVEMTAITCGTVVLTTVLVISEEQTVHVRHQCYRPSGSSKHQRYQTCITLLPAQGKLK